MLAATTDLQPRPRNGLKWALGLAGTLGMLGAVLLVGAAAERTQWQAVALGVEHRVLESPGVQADLIRFDLERFDVTVEVPKAPLTAAAAVQAYEARAAINGGFFDPQWRPLGLRISHGQAKVGLRPHVDWGVLLARSAHAQILHSRQYQASTDHESAIQVGPRLLVDGKPTKLKPQLAYRSAVAVDGSGRFLTLVSTAVAVDANALARALQKVGGFKAAMLLDGGPSAQIFAQAGNLRIDRPGLYAVPDLLLIKSRPAQR